MEFRSGFLDTLKLLLNSQYVVSDKDLVSLSDIIMSFGLEDVTERGILTNLLYFMDSNNLKFPISYNYMKNLWEKSNLTVNFNSILSTMELNKLITLRKLKEETFFGSLNVNKHDIDTTGQPYYVVVYGTAKFNELMQNIKDSSLLMIKRTIVGEVTLTEGVNFKDMSGKYKQFIKKVAILLKTKLFLSFRAESFEYDNIKNNIEFNFVVGMPKVNNRKVKNSDLVRIYKKWTKSPLTLSVNSFIDSEDTIFLNIMVDMRMLPADLNSLANSIAEATNEIIDIVQGGETDGT